MPDLRLPTEVVLVYSPHALEEAENEQGRGIDLSSWLPRKLTLRCVTVVEATIVKDVVHKLVVRYTLPGTDFDMVLVMVPTSEPTRWKVSTVWANRTDDTHQTLNTRHFAMA